MQRDGHKDNSEEMEGQKYYIAHYYTFWLWPYALCVTILREYSWPSLSSSIHILPESC